MRIQAQSLSGLTSHFPFFCPPQGPLTRLLAHRVMGHTPPVEPSTQSPHILQYSLNIPTRSIWPKNKVLLAG